LQVRMEASKQERPEIDRSRSNSCIQRIARERDSNLIRVEPLVAITPAFKTRTFFTGPFNSYVAQEADPFREG